MKKDKDDSIIDLRGAEPEESSEEETDDLTEVKSGDEEFQINKLEEEVFEAVDENGEPFGEISGEGSDVEVGGGGLKGGPSDRVKVKFDKFITLVATHTFEDVLKKNADEDVVISTNLLTDLANAHEEPKGDKKIVVIFAVGLAIGIVLTWLILRT
jgi:hypothetical protein